MTRNDPRTKTRAATGTCPDSTTAEGLKTGGGR